MTNPSRPYCRKKPHAAQLQLGRRLLAIAGGLLLMTAGCADGPSAARGRALARAPLGVDGGRARDAAVPDRQAKPDAAMHPALAFPAATAGAIEVLPAPDGTLAQWLLLGPIRLPPARISAERLRAPLLVATGGPGKLVPGTPVVRPGHATLHWRYLPQASARFDLREQLGLRPREQHRAAFLGLELVVAAPVRGFVVLGHDDGAALWLDGERRHADLRGRLYQRDQFHVPITLARGKHRLVVQLTHPAGRWRLRVRLLGGDLHILGRGGTSAGRVRYFLPPTTGPTPRPGAPAALAQSLRLSIERRVTPRAVTGQLAIRAPGGVPVTTAPATVAVAAPRGTSLRVPVSSRALAEGVVRRPLPRGMSGRLTAQIGRRRISLQHYPRPQRCAELATARAQLRLARARGDLPAASLDSVAYHLQRVRTLLAAGDRDAAYLRRRLQRAATWATALARGNDPLPRVRGRLVKAYRSPLDDTLQPYSLWIPPGYGRRRGWPLYVMLHGMGGRHRKGLSQMLGVWMPEHDPTPWWRFDRRPPAPRVRPPALVLAPHAYGDAFYRYAGELDVTRAIAEVRRHYRVDPRRVILVGQSMGGTGAVELGLRAPHRYAGVVAMAGYPNRFDSREMVRGPVLPWERWLAHTFSPQSWAANALHQPLIAVHGERDGPYRSQHLVRAYAAARSPAELKTFPIGHAVWRKYLDQGDPFTDARAWRAPRYPHRVRFATPRLRWSRAYWVEITARPHAEQRSRVDARWIAPGRLRVRTRNVDGLRLHLDPAHVRASGRVALQVDQDRLALPAAPTLTLHRAGGHWRAGPPPGPFSGAGPRKGPGLEGPLDDVYYGPVRVVYGTRDPRQTPHLARVAERLRRHRWSEVRYPVRADTALSAAERRSHNLILVGGPEVNAVTARYRRSLPIAIGADGIRAGRCRFRGPDVGAKFIVPHPEAPGRYLVVIGGTTALGPLRQHVLPPYLPDFVIYDRGIERGATYRILGPGRRYLAAGHFDRRWRLPPIPCPSGR